MEISASELRESVELLEGIIDEFIEEEESAPTLGEFLEIIGQSVPDHHEFMEACPYPLSFRAKMKGNRWYKPPTSERVLGLNDHAFVEATEFLSLLIDHAGRATGKPISPTDLAALILQVIHEAKVSFADVQGDAIESLLSKAPKRLPKAKIGDVIAIPSGPPAVEGYHLAVVVAADNVGLGLGLLDGIAPTLRLGNIDEYKAKHIPVYTSDHLIRSKDWLIIGHSETLLNLFPGKPDLYWPAVTVFGEEFGEYGGARPAGGTIRLIGKAEAEAVGLLDDSYSQTYVDSYLQDLLNVGHFDNGPTPGMSWN